MEWRGRLASTGRLSQRVGFTLGVNLIDRSKKRKKDGVKNRKMRKNKTRFMGKSLRTAKKCKKCFTFIPIFRGVRLRFFTQINVFLKNYENFVADFSPKKFSPLQNGEKYRP